MKMVTHKSRMGESIQGGCIHERMVVYVVSGFKYQRFNLPALRESRLYVDQVSNLYDKL